MPGRPAAQCGRVDQLEDVPGWTEVTANWNRKLARVLRTTDGVELRTLRDAADFASNPDMVRRHIQERPRWQDAAGLMLEAANGGRITAATDAVETALALDKRLDVVKTPA